MDKTKLSSDVVKLVSTITNNTVIPYGWYTSKYKENRYHRDATHEGIDITLFVDATNKYGQHYGGIEYRNPETNERVSYCPWDSSKHHLDTDFDCYGLYRDQFSPLADAFLAIDTIATANGVVYKSPSYPTNGLITQDSLANLDRFAKYGITEDMIRGMLNETLVIDHDLAVKLNKWDMVNVNYILDRQRNYLALPDMVLDPTS